MPANDIGIDLGTTNCLVYSTGKGLVLQEPSVVVYDKDTEKIRAIGEEAKQMSNHANTYVPNGTEPDAREACSAYNELLHKIGPADIQILGLGHDGHIGFNEPSDHFEDETHCVDLTETTIQANKRFFESEADVPRQAYTMGIGTIMRCKKILVVVSGSDKAQILKKVVQGPVTPQVPGSILQFHPDCTIIADEAALSEMDI